MKSLWPWLFLSAFFIAPQLTQAQDQALDQTQQKYPIYFDFTQLRQPKEGVEITDIINEVEAAPGELFIHTNDRNSAKAAIAVTNQLINQEYFYTFVINAFDEAHENVRVSPKFSIRISSNQNTLAHLATVVKAILNLATVYKDFDEGAPGQIPAPDPTEAKKERRWVFDIGISGFYENSGKESMSGDASVDGSCVGIYKHFKATIAGLGKYTYTKSPSPYGTFKGGSYVAFVEGAMIFNLKEAGNKKDHWNIGLITSSYVMPLTKNADYNGSIDLGAEWVLFPVYDDTQNKNIIVRAGFSGVYNDYHVKTASQKLHEAYAEAFMKFYFVRYAKEGRFKAVVGTDVRFRVDQPKFGTYKLNGGISYAINQHVSFNANFSVFYRPDFIMYPDNFDDDERMAYFFNGYPGFSSEESIGFTFSIGNAKALVTKKRNQRWVNPSAD